MAKNKILIVDDNPGNLQLLQTMVGVGGYECVVTETGTNALDLIRYHMPSLVLLDVRMPEIDGYMIAETVKSDAALQHIPIVFVTAVGDQMDHERTQRIGVEEVLYKPINVKRLLEVITGLVP